MAATLNLAWSARPAVSCYHAVEALCRKQSLADAELADALQEPAAALFIALDWDAPPPERFFDHLVPLSAHFASNLELALTTLTKLVRRDHAEALAFKYRGLLTDVLNAFLGQMPRLQEQWPVAGEALQRAWGEVGPQLMVGVQRETEEQLFVEEAEALLLHPVLGGAGEAHLPYNSVRIETVADRPELPEIVRLTWLLARLNLDLPRFSDLVKSQRLHRVAALAMILPVLAAAKEAKLVGQPDAQPPLQDVLAAWMPGEPPETAEKLRQWWEVYRDTRPPLGAALGALDQMCA